MQKQTGNVKATSFKTIQREIKDIEHQRERARDQNDLLEYFKFATFQKRKYLQIFSKMTFSKVILES